MGYRERSVGVIMAIIPINELPTEEKVSSNKSTIIPISELPEGNGSELANQAIDSFKGAGIEANRGLQEGFGNVVENVGNLAAMTPIDMVTGGGLSGPIKKFGQQYKTIAKNLPQTNMSGTAKGVYNLVGSAGPMVAEYSLLQSSLGPAIAPAFKSIFGDVKAVHNITESSLFAVQGAIDNYRETGDVEGAIKGGVSGAQVGLGLGVAGKALEVSKQYGKGAAKLFIQGVTGDEKLAKDFVNNPFKYNLNPFQKVGSAIEKTKENDAKLLSLRQESDKQIGDLRFKHSQEKFTLDSQIDNSKFQLSESNKTAQKALDDTSKIKLDDIRQKAESSFANSEKSIQDSLFADFKHANEKLELIRSDKGIAVEQAIDNVIAKDPMATVKTKTFFGKMHDVLVNNGYRVVEGQVVPNVLSTADSNITNILQGILDESKGRITPDGIPLGFVQELKQGLQRRGYGSNAPESNILKQLSGALNPVRLGEKQISSKGIKGGDYQDIHNWIIGKDIQPELKQLSKANKEFSELVPSHEEAIKNYTKADASGNAVPDFSKAINAVKNGDRTAIINLKKADLALPEQDRLFPKVEQAVSKINEHEGIKKSLIKNAQRKIQKEKVELARDIRNKQFEINSMNNQKKFQKAESLQKQLNEFKLNKNNEIRKAEELFNAENEHLKGQLELRSAFGKGRAGNLQTAGVLGLVGQTKFPSAIGAAASAALTTIPSPMVASGAVKAGARTLDPTISGLIRLVQEPTTRRSIGSLATKTANRREERKP